jgi:hypothetical protein
VTFLQQQFLRIPTGGIRTKFHLPLSFLLLLSLFFSLLITHPLLSKWLSESSTVSLYVFLIDSVHWIIPSDFIFLLQENGRTIAVLVAAKHNDLDLELVNTQANSAVNTSAEYLKVQPLGKIPAFEGANGFTLSEVLAIAIYGMLMTAVFFFRARTFFHSST